MLELENITTKLSVTIEGYSYPFSRDYFDSNWLSVNVKLYDKNKGLFYDNNDPCLSTIEIVQLKNWVQSIKKDFSEREFYVDFLEPCISFSVEKGIFNVILKYNLNPKYTDDNDSNYIISFVINEVIIDNLLADLDIVSKKFPEKNINLK